jgi:predicted acyl esterase
MATVNDVAIPMSDGVTLYANVGYPADAFGRRVAGTFPVLLSQNPYGAAAGAPNPYFVRRGYIYVTVDVRHTTPRSPAPVEKDGQLFGPRQTQDGVEAVDFVAHRLEGSNGKVGLVGCSFLGINQLFTAAAIGPNSPVKAINPACAAFGYEIFFDGGIPGKLLSLFSLAGESDAPFAVVGSFVSQLGRDIAAGNDEAYDRDFWRVRNTTALAPSIVANDIPTLLWAGWQALESQPAVELYSALQNAASGRDPFARPQPDQPVNGRYQMVMGGGGHAAGLDPAFHLQWFDRWLKDDQSGIDQTSTPLHAYEVGSQRWVNVADLPIAPTLPYYLGGTSLARQAPAAGTAALRYALPNESGGSLTFTSAPLQESMSVAGPTTATIYASSSNTQMALIATLQHVDPLGRATTIADGTLLGSMRAVDDAKSWKEADGRMVKPYHPFTSDAFLTPGQVERFDIELDTTLYAVPAGHALRLVLSTQPASDVCAASNLLAGLGPAIPCNPTDPQKAALAGGTYQIVLGGANGSLVNVPLVKPSDLPATLACTTPTSPLSAQPMSWDGGVKGPRDPIADAASCLAVP